jgi:hypothetical protein
MTGRVDYQIEKYLLTEAAEPERLTRQWAEVMEECREQQSGAEERLRLALLNVDYVTSFELPFRLLLTRAPQLIDIVRKELQLSQKNVLFNGKRFGCVYSLKRDLDGIPDEFTYQLKTRIQRSDATGCNEAPYRQIAQQVKAANDLSWRWKTGCDNGTRRAFLVWHSAHRGRCAEITQNGDEDRDVRRRGV